MARATKELYQAQVTISMRGKELVNITQLKPSITVLKENVDFYEDSGES